MQRSKLVWRSMQWLAAVGAGLSLASPSCGGEPHSPATATASPAALLINTTANQIGRLTSAGTGAMRVYTQYDALGRATATQYVMDQTSYVFKNVFGYPQTALGLCTSNACGPLGAPGRVKVSSTFPDGERLDYTFDLGDAPQGTTTTPCADATKHTDAACTTPGPAATIVSSIVRNVRGQAVQIALGNGTEQDTCYNDGAPCAGATQPSTDLRLNRMRSRVTSTGALLRDVTYGFDPNGNITAIGDALTPALSATYQYDSVDQLTAMTSNGTTLSYGYDPAGNLTTKEGATQSYGGTGRGPHALATAGGLTYDYDLDGNMTTRSDGLTIAWNAENMPVLIAGGAATTTTQRVYHGSSLWKKVQGATTTYYLPALRIEGSGAVSEKYFGSYAERASDGTLKYYHPDHLGSSTLVTDAAGAIVHRAAHLPYGGDRTGIAFSPSYTESFTPKYQFNAQEKQLDGTGLYDYGARLYNPATGRWLSADSSDADGPNRYAYTGNNPIAFGDRNGHDRLYDPLGNLISVWNLQTDNIAVQFPDGRYVLPVLETVERVEDLMRANPGHEAAGVDGYKAGTTTPVATFALGPAYQPGDNKVGVDPHDANQALDHNVAPNDRVYSEYHGHPWSTPEYTVIPGPSTFPGGDLSTSIQYSAMHELKGILDTSGGTVYLWKQGETAATHTLSFETFMKILSSPPPIADTVNLNALAPLISFTPVVPVLDEPEIGCEEGTGKGGDCEM